MKRIPAIPLRDRLARITRDVSALPPGSSADEFGTLLNLFDALGFKGPERNNLRYLLGDAQTALDGITDLGEIAQKAVLCHERLPAEFERFLPYIGCRMYRDPKTEYGVAILANERDGDTEIAIRWGAPGYNTDHLPLVDLNEDAVLWEEEQPE